VPNSAWPIDRQWFLCAKHWPLVSKATKRVLARFRRQEARIGEHVRPAAYHRICRRVFREAGVFERSAPAASGHTGDDHEGN
jgi:hypothetical protein